MAKRKPRNASARKKPVGGMKKTVAAKQASSAHKRTGQQPPLTRESIHVALGEQLTATRGDEVQERAAIASAIDAFMKLAIADGLAANASAYKANCPEFFWEGDGANPPVYARVADATHDDIGRWFQLIVEGVRAYDARVGATA
jgi:hypothetical protein